MYGIWMLWLMSIATGAIFFLTFFVATEWRRRVYLLGREYRDLTALFCVGFTVFGAGIGIVSELCWMLDYRTDFPIGCWALMIVGFLATFTIVATKSDVFRSHHVPRFILNRFYTSPLACV